MPVIKIAISITNHGRWKNYLSIEGLEYDRVKDQIDNFYKHSLISIEKENEHEKIYQDAVNARHK